MTTYNWPAGMGHKDFEATSVPNLRSFSSPYTGGGQPIDLLGERWRFVIDLPAAATSEGGAREALFVKLRGGANLLRLWHFKRPAPLGTMRGAPTVYTAAAQGAQTVLIQTAAGATLKTGDLIGIAGMLLMVAEDCAANGSGVITVPLATRLRASVAPGSSVAWDKPSATFQLKSAVAIGYHPRVVNAVQAEFLEHWA